MRKVIASKVHMSTHGRMIIKRYKIASATCRNFLDSNGPLNWFDFGSMGSGIVFCSESEYMSSLQT